MRSAQWSLAGLYLFLVASASGAHTASVCFEDAVPEQNRKSLQGAKGPYPIGVWVCDWPAGYMTSAMVRILLEEILGFRVVETGPGPSTVDAFYALSGCAAPTNIQDRQCSETAVVTEHHISVEGWTEAYATTWAEIQRDYPQNAPINLGSMGYFGKTSMYLPTHIRQAAYDQEGLILDYYRGYNVSWTQPAKYFDPPMTINTAWLKRCNETRLVEPQAMDAYSTFTGDWEGVEITVDEEGKRVVKGKCWSEYFWYPPACRDDPTKCVIFFTGGVGWNLEETMQKATAWNMPLAPLVAKNWGNFTTLARQIPSTFYWWVPDPTFLLLNPVEITFPPFDRFAHTRGDKRTAGESYTIEKYVSQDLQNLAPAAQELIKAFVLDLEAVNAMLRDQLQTGDSSWVVACRWLRSHVDFWESWMPDPTNCYSGFGLYHQERNSFVMHRQDPSGLICKACPSGTSSMQLKDGKGLTFVCEPCPAGTVQPSGASTECIPCKKGEYQDESGSKECKRCGLGRYQDQTGAVQCIACPADTSTLGLGSSSIEDCGCKEDTINMASSNSVVTCVPCSEGLQCPLGSSVDAPCTEGLECPLGSSLGSLESGVSAEFGSAFIPQIEPGYFSTKERATEIFHCQKLEHCPGGAPGQCAGGREGIPCSDCPPGTSWTGDGCSQCNGGITVVSLAVGSLFFVGLILVYYLVPPRVESIAAPKDAASMCLSVCANLMQCLAIIGLTSVEWPPAFQIVASSSGVILLDLETFSVSCAISGPPSWRYIVSLFIFPVGTSWLVFCFFASSWLRCCVRHKWSRARTMNTLGHFLQVSFYTMSALALQPVMCYVHPNGRHSLLKHAGVFCSTAEHVTMMLFGLLVPGSLLLIFYGTCAWAVWHIPRWSVSQPHRIPAFAFLINKFSMNRWWYGLFALLRGPLLSLCPVVAANFPPAQAALLTAIFAAFLIAHMRFLPWKLPLVNFVDGCVQLLLLLLVAVTAAVKFGSAPALEDLEKFHQGVAVIILLCMGMAILYLAVSVFLAFFYVTVIRRNSGGRKDFVMLNLGRRPQKDKIEKQLKEVAECVLKLQSASVHKGLDSLHCNDLQRIVETIQMIATDIIPAETNVIHSANSRVVSHRARLSMVQAEPTGKDVEDLEAPKDLQSPSPSDLNDDVAAEAVIYFSIGGDEDRRESGNYQSGATMAVEESQASEYQQTADRANFVTQSL